MFWSGTKCFPVPVRLRIKKKTCHCMFKFQSLSGKKTVWVSWIIFWVWPTLPPLLNWKPHSKPPMNKKLSLQPQLPWNKPLLHPVDIIISINWPHMSKCFIFAWFELGKINYSGLNSPINCLFSSFFMIQSCQVWFFINCNKLLIIHWNRYALL